MAGYNITQHIAGHLFSDYKGLLDSHYQLVHQPTPMELFCLGTGPYRRGQAQRSSGWSVGLTPVALGTQTSPTFDCICSRTHDHRRRYRSLYPAAADLCRL